MGLSHAQTLDRGPVASASHKDLVCAVSSAEVHPDGYDCGLIGALGEGCSGPTAVEHTSWGGVKAMFR